MLADTPRDDTISRRSRKLWAAASALGAGGKAKPASAAMPAAAASVPLCVEAKSPPHTTASKHGRRRSLFFRRPSKVSELGSDEELCKDAALPETVIAVDKQLFKLERYTMAAEPRAGRLGMDAARSPRAEVPPSPKGCGPSADVLLQVLLPSNVARPCRPSQDLPPGAPAERPVSPWSPEAPEAPEEYDPNARMPFLELLDSRAAPAGHGALAPPTPLPPRRPKPSRGRTVTAADQAEDISASLGSPQRKRGATMRASAERASLSSTPVRLASLAETHTRSSSNHGTRSRSGSSATLSAAPVTASPQAAAAPSTRSRSGSSASRRTARTGAAQSRRAGHGSRGDACPASRSSAHYPATPKSEASRRQLGPFSTPTFGSADSIWGAKVAAAPYSPSMDSTVAQAGAANDDDDEDDGEVSASAPYSWDFVSQQQHGSTAPASEYFSAVSRRTEFSLAAQPNRAPGSLGLAGLGLMAGGSR